MFWKAGLPGAYYHPDEYGIPADRARVGVGVGWGWGDGSARTHSALESPVNRPLSALAPCTTVEPVIINSRYDSLVMAKRMPKSTKTL